MTPIETATTTRHDLDPDDDDRLIGRVLTPPVAR